MHAPGVLLVEDNEANVYLARFLLERAGARIVVAENGLECLAAVASDPPDLILMDLQMPVMDGFETLRHLLDDPATRDLPVVASSAFSYDEDRERALGAGFVDYIEKPYDPDTFADRVLVHLRRHG